ncbi:MAG: alpha/beta fold hydrolase [Marmoricola sp.]
MTLTNVPTRTALVVAAAATLSLINPPGAAPAVGERRDDSSWSVPDHRSPRSGPYAELRREKTVATQRATQSTAAALSSRPDVKLAPCEEDPAWLCGAIKVPFDRAHPAGRKLSLAFAVLPHSNPDSTRTDPVFASDGGPGSSNVFVGTRGFLGFINQGLTADHDLVVVDHRGTGSSGAVNCPTLQATLGQLLANDPDGAIAEVGRCGRQLGGAADRYGSGDIAMDLDAVRAALGYRKINLYGLSYAGTFLSAYATRYPERLRSLVIDSGTPATDPRHSWSWGLDIPHSYAATVGLDCRRAPQCAKEQPNARTALSRLAKAVRRHPVTGTADVSDLGPRTVTVDERKLISVAAIDLNQAELAAVATALERGDKAPLVRAAAELELFSFQPEDPQVFSEGGSVATFCNDNDFVWNRTDPVPVRRAKYERALAALGPHTFAPFTRDAWTAWAVIGLCLNWPAPDRFVPAVAKGAQVAGVPTLIISGDFDTNVPTATTRELLRIFPRATFQVIPGAGHPAAGWSDCARAGMSEFMSTLSTAQVRSCDEPAWVFETTSKFPLTAADATPAKARAGDRSTKLDRQVAAATVQAVRDVWLRVFRIGGVGTVTGLRGGDADYDITFPAGFAQMHGVRFARDVSVSGDTEINFEEQVTRFTATVDGPGNRDGNLTAVGGFGSGIYTDFLVTGTLGGRRIVVAVPAN